MNNELFLPKHVVSGIGSFKQLQHIAEQKNWVAPFFIYSASALSEQLDTLKQQWSQGSFFEITKGEPTISELKRAIKELNSGQSDCVIAIGGGSVIDLAKAVAVCAINPTLALTDIPNKAFLDRLPIIAVPTTAGTGSEATKITVITDETLQTKLNPAHPSLIPDVVILDASFTVNLPQHITSFTGLDALTHAIEAYVSTKANDMSDLYALEAIRRLKNIEKVFKEPSNIDVRQELLIGSFYAGIAFSNASTNLAHATGRALGAKFHMPHGQCVALMHPFVVDFSMESASERYKDIVKIIGISDQMALSSYLDQLNTEQQVWESAHFLAPLLTDEVIEYLANQALTGNGIVTNRQVPTKEDVESIFKALRKRLQNKGGNE
ncbi:iron-containing alcohol dehydrogenase [Solibacillus sp. FSL W8-0474]|uniref:iron-containing alcohol dehydrogenase family protein n=1 Tax=Solibacillus sp. FSL W8-0474 TaxID=2975336 RepID=UPI0030FAE587